MTGRLLLAAVITALLLPAPGASAQDSHVFGLRIGNAGWGGSESLTDQRTTGAEFSSGTLAGTHPNFGSILGRDGLVLGFGEARGDSTRRLLAPRTAGADGTGGTPSATSGAGGR